MNQKKPIKAETRHIIRLFTQGSNKTLDDMKSLRQRSHTSLHGYNCEEERESSCQSSCESSCVVCEFSCMQGCEINYIGCQDSCEVSHCKFSIIIKP